MTEPDCIECMKGNREKILVRPWETGGYRYVSLAVQTMTERGEYAFMRGRSFALRPEEARELASALLTIAATVDGAPVDPMPTDQDRDESRMP